MTQLTFTEEEVKKTAAFVQFIYDKAVFKELTSKESMILPRYFAHMNELIKKMDSSIFEIRKKIPAPTQTVEPKKIKANTRKKK